MWRLLILLGVFSFSTTVHTGSHSLWVFTTFIKGETPFPELSAVVMLDDVQIGYYDSNIKRYIHQGQRNSEDEDAEQREANNVIERMYNDLTERWLYTKHHSNYTDGIHVQQRLVGCELLDNGELGLMMTTNAINGESADGLLYNMGQYTYHSDVTWPSDWQQVYVGPTIFFHRTLYHPICIARLKSYLSKEKNRVMRKVKPRVRFLQAHPDSGGVQVSCLATGFYPRHINLTLLRDGQPVADHQITGGMLLPNGDGTYQMRKSLEVSAVELREKHLYTCTASHLSLDNKLNITLEYELGPDTVSIVSFVLVPVLVLVCVIVAIAAFIMWRRRRRRRAGMGSKSSLQSSYTAASSTEPSETSEDTSS